MLKVAIVDDEPDLQRLYQLALKTRGYEIVYVANDGTDAVEKNHKTPARIIIMDHRMPTKNGVEATKEILAENPKTKIIFVSCGRGGRKRSQRSRGYTFSKKAYLAKRAHQEHRGSIKRHRRIKRKK